jgi:hypothetical protein
MNINSTESDRIKILDSDLPKCKKISDRIDILDSEILSINIRSSEIDRSDILRSILSDTVKRSRRRIISDIVQEAEGRICQSKIERRVLDCAVPVGVRGS